MLALPLLFCMREKMAVKLVNTVYHHQLGWLRRSELDVFYPGNYVYEDADGDMLLSQDPRHRHRMLLSLWEDVETGERHTTDSPLPYFTGNQKEFGQLLPKPKSPQ